MVGQEWKKLKVITCDATEGHNGEAERTAWKALLVLDRYDYKTMDMDGGRYHLGAVLGEGFRESAAVLELGDAH